jgi:putative Flp pilus-assembly TadE/G-like protein
MLSFMTMRYGSSGTGTGAPRAGGRRLDCGQIFVLSAMALAVLLGCASMALDVGFLWNLRRKAQTAADAAAIGGMRGVDQGSVVSSGMKDAAQNGFTNGSNNVTVKINNPPASGAYVGDPDAVEAIITDTAPTYFLRAVGYPSVPVTARAVAHKNDGPSCIYILNPSVSGALTVAGSSSTLQAQCGIHVNSNSSSAMSLNGGACISATSIGIVGNYSAGSCAPNPVPVTGVVAAADPLANVAAPSVGSCTYTSVFKVGSGTSVTLSPGVYCGGISIAGGGTANLNAGTYVLNGGGLSSASSAKITGTGVTFYNTGSSKTYAPINMTANTIANLSAPTSGALKGILFFEDRSINAKKAETVAGDSTSTFDGALYFLNSALSLNGGSSISGYTLIVADTLSVSGNSSLRDNYTGLADGSPLKTSGLVE